MEAQLALRPGHIENGPGTLFNRELARVANVHRKMLIGTREQEDALDQVVDIAEASCLFPVAINGQRLAAQCLHHEVRDHAPIVRMQPRSICVEDARQMSIHAARTVVSHHQRFGIALGLVIHRPRTDRVYVAPIALRLRMLQRVAVAL